MNDQAKSGEAIIDQHARKLTARFFKGRVKALLRIAEKLEDGEPVAENLDDLDYLIQRLQDYRNQMVNEAMEDC